MYQCGERVLYGIHGVCTVMGIENRIIDRKNVEYYILEPIEQPGARYMVPTQNQAAVSRMKKLLTAHELHEILSSQTVTEDAWIQDENKRKLHYKDLIQNMDRAAILRMICSLYRHKQQLKITGKKFHASDENFLRDAEKLLSAEFSLILNIPQNQVGEYIQNALKME